MTQTNSPEPRLAPVPSVAPLNQVAYYNPTGDLPPRAAATLAKHARPRGDVGDWPLDNARVAQFDQALKLRKKIDAAASLYRLFLFLAVLGDVGMGIGVLGTLASARGPAFSEMIALSVSFAVSLGVTVLYYFAWKSTVRSQRWAALTMGILFTVAGVGYFFGLVIAAANSPRDASGMIVAAVVIAILAGAFAFVSFRAFKSIALYLAQPAWCQELLSKTSS